MVLVSLVNVYFAIPTLIMAILLYFLRFVYVTTSRNIKRVESISKSPIYANTNATLHGLPTIRASNAENAMIQNFNQSLDHNTSVIFFNFSIKLTLINFFKGMVHVLDGNTRFRLLAGHHLCDLHWYHHFCLH
jgi:ABC-type multidrug transport system fused ATPase/permease subunit